MHHLQPFVILISVLLAVGPAGGLAAQPTSQPIFQIQLLNLQIMPYPWGNELLLEISGFADPILANGTATIFVFYNKTQVRKYTVVLVKDPAAAIPFQGKWETINNAWEEILPGPYKLVVQFSPDFDDKEATASWRKRFAYQKAVLYEQTCFLDTEPAYREYSQQQKAYLIAKIHDLNRLFAELSSHKKKALQIAQDAKRGRANEFAERGVLSQAKWQAWLDSFLTRVERHKSELRKSRGVVVAPRYPTTLLHMEEYCNVLIRLGKLYTDTIYEAAQRPTDKKVRDFSDLGDMQRVPDIIRHIQYLHSTSALELQINLQKELGYLPPPEVFVEKRATNEKHK